MANKGFGWDSLPWGSNHLLRMVMEPKYFAEKVIGHPNHPLTFGDWIPRATKKVMILVVTGILGGSRSKLYAIQIKLKSSNVTTW